MFYKNYKKALLISLVIIALTFLIAGVYYVVIYLPKKQKANIEYVKAEMEARIEQEKSEREKIEQALQRLEEEKQQKLEEEQEKQKQLAEEATKKAIIKAQQQAIASSALQKCLDDAEADYKKTQKEINKDIDEDGASVLTGIVILNNKNKRTEAINACNKKYN
jgi:actin-like ATPase involved in cell morphogenesis